MSMISNHLSSCTSNLLQTSILSWLSTRMSLPSFHTNCPPGRWSDWIRQPDWGSISFCLKYQADRNSVPLGQVQDPFTRYRNTFQSTMDEMGRKTFRQFRGNYGTSYLLTLAPVPWVIQTRGGGPSRWSLCILHQTTLIGQGTDRVFVLFGCCGWDVIPGLTCRSGPNQIVGGRSQPQVSGIFLCRSSSTTCYSLTELMDIARDHLVIQTISMGSLT